MLERLKKLIKGDSKDKNKDAVQYSKGSFDDVLKSQEEAERRKTVKRHKEQCIQLAMKEMGWTRKQAVDNLNDLKKRLGIKYIEYRRYHFFEIPVEKQEARLKEIREFRELRLSTHSGGNKEHIAEIAEITGWSKDKVKEEIARARDLCGATVKDYWALEFWKLTPEEQKTFFTQKASNVMSRYYDTNDIYRDILLNKELSNRVFDKFLRRPWGVNQDISFEEFKEKFGASGKVLYKPLNGQGGLGITLFTFTEDDIREKYEEIRGMSRAILEGYVDQHHDLKALNPSSVNTIRVVTVSRSLDGDPAHKEYFNICYAALRIGRGKSVVDNASSGGLVAGIDLETGELRTDAVTTAGEAFTHHPDTGVEFKGFKVPMFREAMKLVEEAGQLIDGYTGWDVAISEDGPVLIEANIMPGNRILEIPYIKEAMAKAPGERTGHRYVMDKYIREAEAALLSDK